MSGRVLVSWRAEKRRRIMGRGRAWQPPDAPRTRTETHWCSKCTGCKYAVSSQSHNSVPHQPAMKRKYRLPIEMSRTCAGKRANNVCR